ncbi:hypothetical protein MBLNU230_g1474t1 [Neophaeotheca triangularis]
MAPSAVGRTPSLSTFLKSLKHSNIETSIELLVSLLKRRQIKNSRPCAIATSQLLLRVVANSKTRDAQTLIQRVRDVGRKLVSAQPREMAVGNIVRRVLGVVREVAEEDQDAVASDVSPSPAGGQHGPHDSLTRPQLSSTISSFSPLHQSAALPHDPNVRPASSSASDVSQQLESLDISNQRPHLATNASYTQAPAGSLFGIFQNPTGASPMGTPPTGTQSPVPKQNSSSGGGGSGQATPRKDASERKEKLDIKAEVIDGIKELIDELEVVDSQIAESALDHIHSNEIILTHTSSQTVQKFLMTAARKRKFTLVYAEAYPNDHLDTHATIVNGARKDGADADDDERWKPLTSMGITVIMIPDSAVFALMSRINKVILAPHAVLANGSLVAAAGATTIAQAAKHHHVPVVVLSGVYKLSPVYPFDIDELIEYGDPSKVVPFQEGAFIDGVDVVNPLYDYVGAELVDLYITNLGGHAPSYLYRIVADHYRNEDIDIMAK